MDPCKTGGLIRRLRLGRGLTQLALARQLHISDKTVSKWERGCGVPELSLLPLLADALQVDMEALLKGELEEHDMSNGNLKKMRFYSCPVCGNLLFSAEEADVRCCGQKLRPLQPQKAPEEQRLTVEEVENEWYVTAAHEMRREHYISFVAALSDDCCVVKKCYPEWDLGFRLPRLPHGMLLWFCTQHGLFYQPL